MRIPPAILTSAVLLCGALAAGGTGCDSFPIEIMYRHAEAAHNQGHYDEAIRLYQKIIEKVPDHKVAHYDLGVAYAESGRQKEAYGQVRQLKKLGYGDLAGRLEKLIQQAGALHH